MILDKDIPLIGGRGAGWEFQRMWRKVQDTLRTGGPLLVDHKGRPLGELRTGGMWDQVQKEWDLFDESLIEAEENAGWSAREISLPFDHANDGVRMTIEHPSQIVWINRADLPEAPWWSGLWWSVWWPIESGWYRIQDALEADLRSCREILAWLRSSWADRPWRRYPEAGGIFWIKGDPSMPPGRVDLRDSSGKTVGRIENVE